MDTAVYDAKKSPEGVPRGFICASGGIRTPDLRIRSPALYPAELRTHVTALVCLRLCL